MALALDKQDKLTDAIAHYEIYLAQMAHRPASALPPPANLIGVALKLADCNARINRSDMALRYYKMARTLAAQTGEKKLESFADVAEASLRAKSGENAAVLPLYQMALRLDAKLDDQHNQAVDWYLYAMFLRNAGFPPRFVYASLLKSQSLLSSNPESDSKERDSASASQIRKDLEHQIGPEASTISRNPDPTLAEALELKQ